MSISFRSTTEENKVDQVCGCISEARTTTSILCTSISLQSIALLTTAAGDFGRRGHARSYSGMLRTWLYTRTRHLRQTHWGTINCQRFSRDHGRPKLMLRFLDVEVEFPEGVPFAARFKVAVKNPLRWDRRTRASLILNTTRGAYRSRTSSTSYHHEECERFQSH